MTGAASVLRGDARHLPLADATVDLICTSLPFLNLRSYQDGGQHYDGQIGTGTQAQFLEDLLAVMAECKRVLKPTGSIFVELGDSYTNKSLNNSPHRFAIACTDRLGFLERAEIVWSRPNGLPESVTDRVRRSHSTWFHFTLEPRYYSAVDEIREQYAPGMSERAARYAGRDLDPNTWASDSGRGDSNPSRGNLGFAHRGLQPLGKLPGSVWSVPTQPLQVPAHLGVDHFAAFPMEWPRRIIRGWSPAEVCTACGEGRRPVATKTGSHREGGYRADNNPLMRRPSEKRTTIAASTLGMVSEFSITGYVCGCPDASAPATPGTVLDPFGGTGTTALVARALGRRGISVDMSADYCRLAEWRVNDPKELARAAQVEYAPPPPPIEGQLGMFEETA